MKNPFKDDRVVLIVSKAYAPVLLAMGIFMFPLSPLASAAKAIMHPKTYKSDMNDYLQNKKQR